MNELRKLARDELGEGMPRMQPPTGFEVAPTREADTGGSGDQHEINWGDVVDVVKEQFDVKAMVHECITKLKMQQVDETNHPIDGLPEYVQIQEMADKFAESLTGLLRQAYKEGMLSNAGLGGG